VLPKEGEVTPKVFRPSAERARRAEQKERAGDLLTGTQTAIPVGKENTWVPEYRQEESGSFPGTIACCLGSWRIGKEKCPPASPFLGWVGGRESFPLAAWLNTPQDQLKGSRGLHSVALT